MANMNRVCKQLYWKALCAILFPTITFKVIWVHGRTDDGEFNRPPSSRSEGGEQKENM